jgi:hypothetical protein
MNNYEIFKKLREFSKITPYRNGYQKLMFLGSNHEYSDYSVGALIYQVYYNQEGTQWYVRTWLDNLDDGSMGSSVYINSEEKAKNIVERVKTTLLDNYSSLPDTFEELNKILLPTGTNIYYE